MYIVLCAKTENTFYNLDYLDILVECKIFNLYFLLIFLENSAPHCCATEKSDNCLILLPL